MTIRVKVNFSFESDLFCLSHLCCLELVLKTSPSYGSFDIIIVTSNHTVGLYTICLLPSNLIDNFRFRKQLHSSERNFTSQVGLDRGPFEKT